MIINDLNYLETSNEEVFGGITFGVLNTTASASLNVVESVVVNKFLASNASTIGYLAIAEAEVVGLNSGTAQAFTIVTPGYTAASSISAASRL